MVLLLLASWFLRGSVLLRCEYLTSVYECSPSPWSEPELPSHPQNIKLARVAGGKSCFAFLLTSRPPRPSRFPSAKASFPIALLNPARESFSSGAIRSFSDMSTTSDESDVDRRPSGRRNARSEPWSSVALLSDRLRIHPCSEISA